MTTPATQHLDDAALAAYWAHDDDAVDIKSIEEHVFACDACARALAATGALVRAIPDALRGGLAAAATSAVVARLEREGVRIRQYRVVPGGSVACSAGADDDLLAAFLVTAPAALAATRVDVEWRIQGALFHRFVDVPIDRANAEIVYLIPGAVARAWPTGAMLVRVLAVDDAGDRALGDYTFDHIA